MHASRRNVCSYLQPMRGKCFKAHRAYKIVGFEGNLDPFEDGRFFGLSPTCIRMLCPFVALSSSKWSKIVCESYGYLNDDF